MGRWDPRPLPGDRADDDPIRLERLGEDVDDPAETRAHAEQQAARIAAQLDNHPPTDPALLERLRRELAHWRHVADTTGLDWSAGDGDRTLF